MDLERKLTNLRYWNIILQYIPAYLSKTKRILESPSRWYHEAELSSRMKTSDQIIEISTRRNVHYKEILFGTSNNSVSLLKWMSDVIDFFNKVFWILNIPSMLKSNWFSGIP